MIELGCGVGGLLPALAGRLSAYLGVDSSFASVAHARRLALHPEDRRSIRVPADLLQGVTSREIPLPPEPAIDFPADFVVGDLEHPPLQPGAWDACAALNAIDMMHEPRELPELQHSLLKPGGLAYQSGPYIWHEAIAQRLRQASRRPDSAGAVEWLYEQSGFEIARREDHVPWLFFKHHRQLEIYSVHLIEARKATKESAKKSPKPSAPARSPRASRRG
jgi:SAM-dependent methyltransferase